MHGPGRPKHSDRAAGTKRLVPAAKRACRPKSVALLLAPQTLAPSQCGRKAQAASRAFRTHSNKGWHNANGLIHSAPLACDQSSDRERSKMAQLVVMYKTPKDT